MNVEFAINGYLSILRTTTGLSNRSTLCSL